MQRQQLQTIAVGAGLVAVVAALATGRLPRWLRVLTHERIRVGQRRGDRDGVAGRGAAKGHAGSRRA